MKNILTWLFQDFLYQLNDWMESKFTLHFAPAQRRRSSLLPAVIRCPRTIFPDGKCPDVISYKGTIMYRVASTDLYSYSPNSKLINSK